MAVAVSSSYVVQLVNSSIAVYNKSGVLQAGFPKSLSSFFSSNSGDMGDVRAFYDWSAGRFVVLADDFTAGVVHLAASTTSNPLGSWRQYSFNPWGAANCRASGNSCPDFPQLGYDDSTIYIGVNFFPASGGVSDWMLLLPKSKIYSGSGFGYNYWFNLNWGGVNVDTVHPAVLLTAAEHPIAGVAVNTFNINFGIYSGGCQNGLLVWAFSNNLTSSPTITAAFTGTANNYCMPPSANQPGWANSIDTGDVRISGTPIYHAGMIAASFNTNAGDAHSHSLWFQARPFLSYNGSNWQMAAVQLLAEDCFYCGGQGTNGSSFYGALSFNDGGDLSMIYNYSDDNTYPESAYTGRHAMNYLANYMEGAGFVMCGGSGLYGQGRWGDYEANVADLSSNLTNYSWFSGMNDSGGNWGTCIGKLSFPRYD
jgi:hypothetical protein